MNTLFDRRRSLACITFLTVATMFGACATINTGSYADDDADFSTYQSFSWIDDSPYVAAAADLRVNALALSMIEANLREQLEQRGYQFTEDRDAADFLVAYTVGTRDKIRMDSYPVGYRGHWGWHHPQSHYYFRHVSAENYTQGTLGVDIFDNETGKPVWHGWAEKTVTEEDRANPGPTIEEGIAKLFLPFPE